MSQSINRVLICGRLGQDPRATESTTPFAVFSVATSKKWKDQSGTWQEKTEWHNIKAFKYNADYAIKHLRKGSLVTIEGELSTDKYTDKQGVERQSTSIIANSIVAQSSEAVEAPVLAGDSDSEMPF